MTRSDTRHESLWPLTLALLVFLAVGVSALGELLAGSGWWVAMVGVAAVVLGFGALFRRAGMDRRLVPLAGVGVLVGVLTLFFGAGTGIVWLIPTPATITHLDGLIAAGSGSIAMQNIPATVDSGILFLLTAGAGLLAVVMDALAIAFRWPALAGLPVLITLAVPGLLIDGGASPTVLTLAAVAYLGLLRIDVRLSRRAEARLASKERSGPSGALPGRSGPGPLWGSVVVGSIGIVGALVLSIVTPALGNSDLVGTRATGLLFGSGVSPLIDIGTDLRRPEATPVLHYTTSASEQPYFKLLTLDRFAGNTWTSSDPPGRTDTPVADMTRPPALSETIQTVESTTQVSIDRVATTWLPAPSPAVAVNGLRGSWYWNSSAQVITSANSTTRGQQYRVTALQLAPTKEQLGSAGTSYPESMGVDLEVPVPRPGIIDQTAREVTAGSTSPYEMAVALQDYLRGEQFVYTTEAPVSNDSGAGVDVIGRFLEVKSGYCVHFASAMAIMARTLGIPARISVGYLPGVRAQAAGVGSNEFQVDSHDLHSWPELYFGGIGWVPFEPTPGRGTVPGYATPTTVTAPQTSPNQPVPSTAPRPQQAPHGLIAAEPPAAQREAEAAGSLQRLVFVGLGVLLLLAAPLTVRRLRRRGRLRRLELPGGAGREAWRELADSALDYGLDVSDTQTARELASAINERVGARPEPTEVAAAEVASALQRLLVDEERARYARPNGTGPVGEAVSPLEAAVREQSALDLRVVTRAVRVGSGRRSRILALVLPASLWPSVLGGLHVRRHGRAVRDA
ncbi:transglutaminase TgpA family protein [Glaciibacter psychrotolerans]|uniref:Transglutaminase-like putative cysteine protease n=1 Tax=Glaciibacter psychrotolerans TaxID=670054 RepID=A0A7Z0EEH1_9MICO|nr:DUF3488 and transglutaminase-like domain-containing protein [Leifsonia psychrotolerans]NYJ19469.1 transglutaminase-like putative cysteine protease [Leifsonia psychrotolerans]